MEKGDLDLEKGQLYVPSRRSRLSRTLDLRSYQILAFDNYLRKDRVVGAEKLFSPQETDYHLLHNQLKRLSRHVKAEGEKKLGLKIEKLNHLRQSKIYNWIATEGLRRTQYLCGFKTIRSVEKYKRADLKDLQSQIKVHHPLG